jgi:hypothetical protein
MTLLFGGDLPIVDRFYQTPHASRTFRQDGRESRLHRDHRWRCSSRLRGRRPRGGTRVSRRETPWFAVRFFLGVTNRLLS